MPLGVEIQDEWGGCLDSVIDPNNLPGQLLPNNDDPVYPMLASIDFYGDTVFNRIQMPRFLFEWSCISAKTGSKDEKDLMAKIEAFARRVRDEAHLYLKFIGD